MNDLLDQARFCHRLSTGPAEENEHFAKKVKPILGELIELIGALQQSVADLQKKLKSAELARGEYETRAESQDKRNQKLNDELARLRGELQALEASRPPLNLAASHIEEIQKLRSENAFQKTEIDRKTVGIGRVIEALKMLQ